MQLQTCSSSNFRELFRAFYYFSAFIFLQKSHRLDQVFFSDDHFPQWTGILKQIQGWTCGSPSLYTSCSFVRLPGTRWWQEGGGSCWEPPGTISMWPSRDFNITQWVAFGVFLTRLHLIEFWHFLGYTQKTDIGPQNVCYLDKPYCREQPINCLKRDV